MAAVFMAMMIGILSGLGSGYYIWGREPENTVDLKAVEVPDWVQQDFLTEKYFFTSGCDPQAGEKYSDPLCRKSGNQCKGYQKLF